jgi:hypothetical protein
MSFFLFVFTKMENRKAKQVLSGRYQWEGGGYKERV